MNKLKETLGNLNSGWIKRAINKLKPDKVKETLSTLHLNRIIFKSIRGKQILYVSLTIILSIFIITFLSMRENETSSQITAHKGNSIASIMTGGHLAKQEDWIFYSHQEGLFMISSDLEERTLISSYSVENINLAESWIYFTIPERDGIFRIRDDGTDKTKISDSIRPRNLLLVGESIYFTSQGIVYRLDLEENQKHPLSPDHLFTTTFDLDEEWIYFTVRSIAGDFLPEHGFYRVGRDGADYQQLLEIPIIHFPFMVHEDWIYFIHVRNHQLELEGNGLYRLHVEGDEGPQLLYAFDSIMEPVFYLNIINNNLYFSVGYGGFHEYGQDFSQTGLRRLSIDGGEMETVSTASSNVIHIQGNRIYHRHPVDFERTDYTLFKSYFGDDQRHVLH